MSVQAYVTGRPGNVAAACLDGELLGAVQAEVLRSNGDLGPSTVVRVIDHPEMLATARVMAKERSGSPGSAASTSSSRKDTGRAFLIEINAHATPTCHLVAADETGTSSRRCEPPPGMSVRVLEPTAIRMASSRCSRKSCTETPPSTFLASGYHDECRHTLQSSLNYALGRHGAWGRLRRTLGRRTRGRFWWLRTLSPRHDDDDTGHRFNRDDSADHRRRRQAGRSLPL